MAGVSGTLSWQDVKEWLEKQEPYLLQAVLKTTTNLLVTHCNNSEQSAAPENAKDDILDDQEEKKEEVEAKPVNGWKLKMKARRLNATRWL